MVLAASNADHTLVRLLEAPADAKPGDRITFADAVGEPATPAQMAKKKIWEKLSPEVGALRHYCSVHQDPEINCLVT